MKNFVIALLIILVLCLGGYLVYDKIIDKDSNGVELNDSIETTSSEEAERKEYEYVGSVISGSKDRLWPKEMGKEPDDPDHTYISIDIPEILIDTETTHSINERIVEDHKYYIEEYENSDLYSYISEGVVYDYTIFEQILFINVERHRINHRGSGYFENNFYYYDIANDKELTLEEVISKFHLTIDNIKTYEEEQGNSTENIAIYGAFPISSVTMDIYYRIDEGYYGNQTSHVFDLGEY